MQELVYLSKSKLAQFQDIDAGRRKVLPKRVRVKVDVPGFSMELEGEGSGVDRSTVAKLAAVVEHLGIESKWYEDTPLRAGEWIHFEAPMKYWIDDLKHERFHTRAEAILFVDAPLLKPGLVRLLLHGSLHHALEGAEQWGTTGEAMRGRAGASVIAGMDRIASELLQDEYRPTAPRTLTWSIDRLADFLTDTLNDGTASWMAGLARVTFVTPARRDLFGPAVPNMTTFLAPVVAASPLYVQRIPPPSDR